MTQVWALQWKSMASDDWRTQELFISKEEAQLALNDHANSSWGYRITSVDVHTYKSYVFKGLSEQQRKLLGIMGLPTTA